jgi:hypothetical protein
VPPLVRVPNLANLMSKSLKPSETTFTRSDLSNTIGLEDPKAPPAPPGTDKKP